MPVSVEIPTVLAAYTNGVRSVPAAGANVAELIADLESRHPGLRARLVGEDGSLRRFINVYINDSNVRFERALQSPVADGDVITIIPAVAGGAGPVTVAPDSPLELDEPWLVVDGQPFRSRLLVGIEQYESAPLIREVLEASGCDVFITTVDPDSKRSSMLLTDLADELPLDRYRWIGTTSFARSARDALATARLLRDSYGITVIKLDVRTGDNRPDNAATVEVARTLRAEGLELLPFIRPDRDAALALRDLGCAALRVMAAPVGSGLGVPGPEPLREIIEAVDLPVIVEGGLGTAHHVTLAMELGAAGVLVNTALVRAAEPTLLAASMRHAVRAGRLAWRSGPMPAGQAPAA